MCVCVCVCVVCVLHLTIEKLVILSNNVGNRYIIYIYSPTMEQKCVTFWITNLQTCISALLQYSFILAS